LRYITSKLHTLAKGIVNHLFTFLYTKCYTNIVCSCSAQRNDFANGRGNHYQHVNSFTYSKNDAKAMMNSLWDPWKKKINNYYRKVNAHDEGMGLRALHYVTSEKMIKMEVNKEGPDNNDNVDNSLTSCNKTRRKDIDPCIQITTAAISVFSGYFKTVHNTCIKHTNIFSNKKTLNQLYVKIESRNC